MATVIYDGDCGFCQSSIDWVERLDWLRTMRFLPLQSEEAGRIAGVPKDVMQRRMQVALSGRTVEGFRAAKAMVIRLPLFWIVVAGLGLLSPWLWLVVGAGFLPVFNGLGMIVYDWVARNRHRLPGSTKACRMPSRS